MSVALDIHTLEHGYLKTWHLLKKEKVTHLWNNDGSKDNYSKIITNNYFFEKMDLHKIFCEDRKISA